MKTQTERRWPEREECDPLDVEALDRCIDQARRDERGLDRGHYDSLLKESQWYDVAHSAVYHCQMKSLGLAPHEFPPYWYPRGIEHLHDKLLPRDPGHDD